MGTDPTTYKEALEMLKACRGNDMDRPLAKNTRLRGVVQREPGTAGEIPWNPRRDDEPLYLFIEYHNTRIVKYWPNGNYTLSGVFTPTTRNRMNRFSPFRAFAHNGIGFIGTRTKTRAYRAGMKLRTNGGLIVQPDSQLSGEKWMNPIDAMEYYDQVLVYASHLARRLVNGLLEGWTNARRSHNDSYLVSSVKHKRYTGAVVTQILDDVGQLHVYQKLLNTLHPKSYPYYWRKPTNEGEEVERYALQFKGFYDDEILGNFKHPRKKQVELKQTFIDGLLAAFGLSEAERSGW